METVRRLLETAIDVDHVNDLGWTALLEAVHPRRRRRAHTEIVRLLVDAGADAIAADRERRHPARACPRAGCDEEIAGILDRASSVRLSRSGERHCRAHERARLRQIARRTRAGRLAVVAETEPARRALVRLLVGRALPWISSGSSTPSANGTPRARPSLDRHRLPAARAYASSGGSHSTVTVFARFRGWSTLRPRRRAMRYARSWSGITASTAERNAGAFGT